MPTTNWMKWTAASGGNDHWYKVVVVPYFISWDNSNVDAQTMGDGAHLATITSAAENAFIVDLLHDASSDTNFAPFIGGFQPPGSPEPTGGWQWVTGEPFTYTNWNSGEPNNADNTINEDRLHFFFGLTGTWNDCPASFENTGYVVESETVPPGAEPGQSLIGTNGDNVLTGGAGPDTIEGLGGNDTLIGSGSSDQIFGGGGDDTISGDAGNDDINGGSGLDTIDGGSGNDILRGGGANDAITGGMGDDTVYGGDGQDVIDGGDGNDSLLGNNGNDLITGEAGNDTLIGGLASDTLDGGAGDDTIFGAEGKDSMIGSTGDDSFRFADIAHSTPTDTDKIAGFDGAGVAGGDVIILGSIDANTTIGGNQAFTFIGTAAFSHTASELRVSDAGTNTLVRGDVNGDGLTDLQILIQDGAEITAANYNAGDFVL